MMTPDDRPAALLALACFAVATTFFVWLVWLICDLYARRPVVTKDPHTGQLYIPRSNLTVGPRTRRHRGVTKPRS